MTAPMNIQRTAGVVLLVLGVILFVIGMNASDSVSDQLSNVFTGNYTDATVWYFVGGILSGVVGFLLVIFGGRAVSA
jgi:hypothetical protein